MNATMEAERAFAEEEPRKLFRRVAVPGTVSMLVSNLYSVFEGMFIGKFMGATAFAAMNFSFPLVFLNFAVSDLIGVGSSAPISIALGKKKNEDACNIFTCAVILIMISAALLGGVLYLVSPAIIRLMGAEGEMAEMAVTYIRVFASTAPFTTMVFAFDNYLRICGREKFCMWLNVSYALLTVLALTLFIKVFDWGIFGAALAIPAALVVTAVVGILPFLRGKLLLRFVRPRLSFALIAEIFSCGMPTFLSNIANQVTSLLMDTVLIRAGGEMAVTIYGVVMYSDLLQPLVYGMVDSLSPAIGYNLGAKLYERVRTLRRYAFVSALVISLIGFALTNLFPSQICSLFLAEESAELLPEAVRALRIYSLSFLFFWIFFPAASFFSAVEQPKAATLISVCSTLIFPAVLIFSLSGLGLTGLWLNRPLTNALTALIALALLTRMEKKIFG